MARPALTLAPLGFLELEPPTLLAVAAAAGFASVALRTAPAVPGGRHHPLRAGSGDLRRATEEMRRSGVTVLQVELIVLDRSTDVASHRPMLEAGAALGAERLVVNGDDPDPAVVVAKLAEVAELAAEHGMTVDVEFMPFRALATLEQASAAVAAAGHDNVAVMVDSLHLARSGGAPADIAAADPRRLAVLQLSDAPLAPPPAHLLADEAREGRLLPGAGELPLEELVLAMPPTALVGAEVPMRGAAAARSPLERAAAIFRATAEVLERAAPAPRSA